MSKIKGMVKNPGAGVRFEDPDSLSEHAHSNWVRTGGAIGDTAMHEQRVFNDTGAGVVEKCQVVNKESYDPNLGNKLPQQEGAED